MLYIFVFTAKAATKIQAVFRGHKVRNTMKKTETKTATTSSNNAAETAAAATEKEPTKEELEAEFDPNDKGRNRCSFLS